MQSCQIKPGNQEHSDNSIYLWPCIWRQTLFILWFPHLLHSSSTKPIGLRQNITPGVVCGVCMWSLTAPLLYVERMHHWSHVLKPRSCDYWGHAPQQLKPLYPRARGSSTREATTIRSPCTTAREEPLLTTTREATQLWRRSTANYK